MHKSLIGLTIIFLCLPVVATGEVINVPGEQPTIQAGIDAAVAGDIVLVADGTYTGLGNIDLSLNASGVTVKSKFGPENCIIDCAGGWEPGVNLGGSAVIEGFTIMASSGSGVFLGGTATIRDCIIGGNMNGGIIIEGGSPTISGCTITYNYRSGSIAHGAGIHCWWSSPLITGCTITQNTAYNEFSGYGQGGGIWCTFSTPVIVNNIITSNYAHSSGGGIAFSEDHSFHPPDGGRSPAGGLIIISGNRITDNDGGGIYETGTEQLELTNNVIADNLGSGVFCSNAVVANCTFENNRDYELNIGGTSNTVIDSIIWGDDPLDIRVQNYSTLDISYCNVNGGQSTVVLGTSATLNWGDGMVDILPQLVTGPLGDHYLAHLATGHAADSPCIDAGSGAALAACYSNGAESVCMGDRSTRLDECIDLGLLDMGYHYPALPSTVQASMTCSPTAGTLPFSTVMTATLTNRYTGQSRRAAGRLNATLANGVFIGSWRAGFTNVAADSSYVSSWLQELPALGSLVGDNVFELVVADVTPAPYNQPPYPPAGDTSAASCTVTGTTP